MKYSCILLLGVICLILSGEILTFEAVTVVKGNSDELVTSMPLIRLMDYLASTQAYTLCNLLFTFVAIYNLSLSFIGNTVLGFRFASPLFYNMQENETQFGAFMFNICVLNSSVYAITLQVVN